MKSRRSAPTPRRAARTLAGRFRIGVSCLIATTALSIVSVRAGDGHPSSADLSLAHLAQNPLADAISVPFSNETNFRLGPYRQTGNVLNLQPVVPFRLNDDWNLVTRTTIPLQSQVRLSPSDGPTFGVGDIVPMVMLSPAHPGDLIWGVGPTFSMPTATDRRLGTGRWAAGPSGVLVVQPDPWVFGILASQLWGIGDPRPGETMMNRTTTQLFAVRNFDDGWYASSSPIITADWSEKGRDRWTVPLGGEIGRVFDPGGQAMVVSAGAYYNVVRPREGAEWQARVGLTLIFPK